MSAEDLRAYAQYAIPGLEEKVTIGTQTLVVRGVLRETGELSSESQEQGELMTLPLHNNPNQETLETEKRI